MSGVFKLMTDEEWNASLGSGRTFLSSSGNDVRDGFIHCASHEQVPGPLTDWYSDRTRMPVVEIDPATLDAEVRWVANPEGELWPHIHGSIIPEAVAGVRVARRQEGGAFLIGPYWEGR